MMISSLDGAATLKGLSGGLSSPADQMLMDTVRSAADAVIVGLRTLQSERYGGLRLSPEAASWRLAQGLPPHPTLVAVSRQLDCDPQERFLADAPVRPLILTSTTASQERIAALSAVADIVIAGNLQVDPAQAHCELANRGYQRLQCEGGPSVLSSWYTAGKIAQLNLTVANSLVGAQAPRIMQGVDHQVRHTELQQVLRAGSMLFMQHTLVPKPTDHRHPLI